MTKRFKKKLPKILIGASVILFFAGLFIIAFTLNDTYQLVGECEPGGPDCAGITWQDNLINLGSALLFIGPVLALVGIIIHERNKKPKAEKEEPTKKQQS